MTFHKSLLFTTVKKNQILTFLGVALCAALITTLLIYLTPLKHWNLITPALNSVDAVDFFEKYKANPDHYIFVDVRSPSIYQSAHAKGAINIPIENLYTEHYLLPKSGKEIVLICTTGRLAAIAYGYLEDMGFTNLLHIQGGLRSWTYEGLPLEGANPSIINDVKEVDEHQ